ncbi:4Fe-4S dicluster domain-containing protein [Candidatus Bipolaricaulota bacterium]|nr:4Fe-4S dicluster domain-containing protein [Candidatus Bipolaricaulota bacterium]
MKDRTRRGFLKAAGCLAIGAGLARPISEVLAEAVNDDVQPGGLTAQRWAIAINVRRCLQREGCRACIDACHVEHNVPTIPDIQHEVKWIWKEQFKDVFKDEVHAHMDVALTEKNALVLCNHCDNPPCVGVCPTKATWKRPDGIVMMDEHRCIGCRYCITACPYGARSFNWQDPHPFITTGIRAEYPTRTKGVVEKCTLCTERLAKGLAPSCVEVCNKVAGPGTMVFGDIAEVDSKIAQALKEGFSIRRKPAQGTEPQVYYIL